MISVLSLVFLIIFSLFLLIINIHCFINNKYLYVFVPCFLFLPDYYGLEFSSSLPILTVKRIMVLILFIYAYKNKKTILNETIINKLPKYCLFLLLYFVFRIISNLFYISKYNDAIKSIFEILVEQLFVFIAIFLLAPVKKEIDTILKIIVWTAFTLFIIGIFESFTSIRPFDSLYTVSRYMLNDHYVRLGLLRSTTTMGLPNFFGNICILTLPLAMHFHLLYKEKKYLFVIFVDFFATIHSGCRSIIFFSIILLAVSLIFLPQTKMDRLLFFRNIFIIVITLLTTISILCFISNKYKYYYVGIGKSLLNEIGFQYDLDEGAPEGVSGFGQNSLSGKMSRSEQFSGIPYTLSINPLFGLGSGAQNRGDIAYYAMGKEWRHYPTYDLGLVEIIGDEGLLGLLGFIFLFIYISILISGLSFNTVLKKTATLMLVAYLFTTLNTINMVNVLITYVIMLTLVKFGLGTADVLQ